MPGLSVDQRVLLASDAEQGDRLVFGHVERILPTQLGCGSGPTCWRRLREWHKAGVWERLHATLLNWPGDEGAIDWSRSSVESVSVRAKRGGADTGPNPVDRGKRGSNYMNDVPTSLRRCATSPAP